MKSFTRKERVGGLIQRTLSEILIKGIKDPRLEGVSITDVRMSSDLKTANVYFVTPGGSARCEDALAGFQSAAGYVKRCLGQTLELRYMPVLRFFYDASIDYGTHIDQLLKRAMDDHETTDHSTTEK